MAGRRLTRRPGTFRKAARTPLGIASGILLALILLLAIIAPILWTSQANAIDSRAATRMR